jgi:hypothetical protein
MRGYCYYFRLFLVSFRDGEAAATSKSQNKVLPPYIRSKVVCLMQAEGVGVVCPDGSLGSGWFSYLFVGFQVSLFRSRAVIIGDGCCSNGLVFWGISTTTSRSSTTTNSTATNFARLQ